jgi:phosphatidylserine decarboxylase
LNAAHVDTVSRTPRRRHPLIAREGWFHIAFTLALTLVVQHYAGLGWAAPLWLLTLFMVQFFRDPVRYIPLTARAVICPADGRVIAVGEAEDPYLKRPSVRISVFMNVFNVHSNRSPVAGSVRERWYSPGRFFNAALDKASEQNERNALWIHADEGQDVVVVQVAGLIARRILCYAQPGGHVGRGERFGFIRFGSRVDLYLPLGSSVKVALGDKVTAGNDIVAYLPEH